jgi:hypothetical protein
MGMIVSEPSWCIIKILTDYLRVCDTSVKGQRTIGAPLVHGALHHHGVFQLLEPNIPPRRRGSRWLPPGYIGVDDMTATAPLSRASLYREVASGRLPATRWRGRVLVAERAYRDWLATVPSGVEPVTEPRHD